MSYFRLLINNYQSQRTYYTMQRSNQSYYRQQQKTKRHSIYSHGMYVCMYICMTQHILSAHHVYEESNLVLRFRDGSSLQV